MIEGTSGKGSARFVKPLRARASLRWTPEEQAIIDGAVADLLNLEETCELLPHRSRDSVKARYYQAREGSEEPPTNCRQRNKALWLEDFTAARFQKDAIAGSAMLLEAIVRFHPEIVFGPRKKAS
jgi:hypothetical protein